MSLVPREGKCAITYYFAPGQTPVPPGGEVLKGLFVTNNDRFKVYPFRKYGKRSTVYKWYSTREGELKAGCHSCTRNSFIDILAFAPMDGSSSSQGAHDVFVASYTAYKQYHELGDRDECRKYRGVLEKLRTNCCTRCREEMCWKREKRSI